MAALGSAAWWARTAMGDAVEEAGDGSAGVDGVVGERRGGGATAMAALCRRCGGGATAMAALCRRRGGGATAMAALCRRHGGGCDGCGRGGGCDGCGRYPPMCEDEPSSWVRIVAPLDLANWLILHVSVRVGVTATTTEF
ncbi:hypothetical protein [Oryza sativa Japonica Group]|uniref:Uncharacterized protein n=1 Tax=Oryza sativa subsp. japonica TaxID=39947 RepID=Q5JNF9_ORYSJ|nr:hypothetical protein [Oryza sativa Japonica Group]BAD86998.1 hypothetical protein [Oryza sativa Japonica Group]